jgi:hypothetical protein
MIPDHVAHSMGVGWEREGPGEKAPGPKKIHQVSEINSNSLRFT